MSDKKVRKVLQKFMGKYFGYREVEKALSKFGPVEINTEIGHRRVSVGGNEYDLDTDDGLIVGIY